MTCGPTTCGAIRPGRRTCAPGRPGTRERLAVPCGMARTRRSPERRALARPARRAWHGRRLPPALPLGRRPGFPEPRPATRRARSGPRPRRRRIPRRARIRRPRTIARGMPWRTVPEARARNAIAALTVVGQHGAGRPVPGSPCRVARAGPVGRVRRRRGPGGLSSPPPCALGAPLRMGAIRSASRAVPVGRGRPPAPRKARASHPGFPSPCVTGGDPGGREDPRGAKPVRPWGRPRDRTRLPAPERHGAARAARRDGRFRKPSHAVLPADMRGTPGLWAVSAGVPGPDRAGMPARAGMTGRRRRGPRGPPGTPAPPFVHARGKVRQPPVRRRMTRRLPTGPSGPCRLSVPTAASPARPAVPLPRCPAARSDVRRRMFRVAKRRAGALDRARRRAP
mgnify:CR=1 FL=1